MNKLLAPRGARVLALLAVIAIGVGCRDAVRPQEQDILEGRAPGIHPVLVVAGRSGTATTVELHLRLVQVAAGIASFQGEVDYDSETLRLAGAEIPSGISAEWNEVAPGRVHFAGAATAGVGSRAVLRRNLSPIGSARIGAEDFKVRIEELIATEGFENLTTRVVVADPPLFSPKPLAD